MVKVDGYNVEQVVNVTGIVAADQTVDIYGRIFMIANTGAQPLYFNNNNSQGMLVPAGTVFPVALSMGGKLHLQSNATGTTASILILS